MVNFYFLVSLAVEMLDFRAIYMRWAAAKRALESVKRGS